MSDCLAVQRSEMQLVGVGRQWTMEQTRSGVFPESTNGIVRLFSQAKRVSRHKCLNKILVRIKCHFNLPCNFIFGSMLQEQTCFFIAMLSLYHHGEDAEMLLVCGQHAAEISQQQLINSAKDLVI